jgi:hypothetical protein
VHYAQRKTLQRAIVVCYITEIRLSRMILGEIFVCYITDVSWPKCRQLDHEYNSVAMTLGPAAILGPRFCIGSWKKRLKGRKGSNIVGTYIPYKLPQTKGKTCAKFDWDWFRNVDLYKVQKKWKQTKRNEQKTILSLYTRFDMCATFLVHLVLDKLTLYLHPLFIGYWFPESFGKKFLLYLQIVELSSTFCLLQNKTLTVCQNVCTHLTSNVALYNRRKVGLFLPLCKHRKSRSCVNLSFNWTAYELLNVTDSATVTLMSHRRDFI